PLKEEVVGDVRKVLWVLMGTVTIVLLIACANVANLLLVRIEGRRHEWAIRTALGASRSRIACGVLVEGILLVGVSSVIGLAILVASLYVLRTAGPADLPRLDQISIDAHVLLFTLAVAICTSLMFGIVAALKYAGSDTGDALSES